MIFHWNNTRKEGRFFGRTSLACWSKKIPQNYWCNFNFYQNKMLKQLEIWIHVIVNLADSMKFSFYNIICCCTVQNCLRKGILKCLLNLWCFSRLKLFAFLCANAGRCNCVILLNWAAANVWVHKFSIYLLLGKQLLFVCEHQTVLK